MSTLYLCIYNTDTQVNLSSETLDKVPLTQYSEDAGSPKYEEELPPYSPSPAQSLGVNITKVQPLTKKNVPNGGRVLNDPPMDSIHLAIFTMICCCWPCGLVGLLHGIKVNFNTTACFNSKTLP